MLLSTRQDIRHGAIKGHDRTINPLCMGNLTIEHPIGLEPIPPPYQGDILPIITMGAFVEGRGIEPLFWEPKSHVLPLDEPSITLQE